MTFIEFFSSPIVQKITAFIIWMSTLAATKIIGEKYRLNKKPKLPKAVSIKKVTIPGELKDVKPRVKKELSGFNEQIDFFVKTLEKKYPKEYLKNLYHNLSYLTVRKKPKPKLYKGAAAYNTINNNIYITVEDGGSLYHELFHMASRRDSKHIGFSQHNGLMFIGDELNEGFTDVLSKRNFEGYRIGYLYYFTIASILEDIVGPKMTQYYFESNLLGLIEELKKYISEEEVMQFLTNLRELGNLTEDDNPDKKLDNYSYRTVVMLVGKISKFILEIYDSYLKKELQEGRITYEEYINGLQGLMRTRVMEPPYINGRMYANPLFTYDMDKGKTVLSSDQEDVSKYQSMGL